MSKGLKVLKYLRYCQIVNGIDCEGNIMLDYLFRVKEEIFNIIEKELKALEIIKNKRVDVLVLLTSIGNSMYKKPLEIYNSYVFHISNAKLTQQEFDLLREVLEE